LLTISNLSSVTRIRVVYAGYNTEHYTHWTRPSHENNVYLLRTVHKAWTL